FKDTFTGRLTALADVHRLLTGNKWKGVLLGDLAKAATYPYAPAYSSRVSVSGDDIILNNKAAQAFYMVVHELASNAAKYGAFSVPNGRVDIAWELKPEQKGQRLLFRWSESGGPPVAKPQRRGFGSELIERSMSYEL